MTALVVAGVSIRQDAHGRFCLNDLHRAAGHKRKQGPSLWLDNQQTQELIEEVAREMGDTGNPVSVVKGGLQQGTYVCREMVYAYAMWISAKFHLKVIRAYDASFGKDLRNDAGLFAQRLALEFRDTSSKQLATIGSGFMNRRRREVGGFKAERARLDQEMQGGLFSSMTAKAT